MDFYAQAKYTRICGLRTNFTISVRSSNSLSAILKYSYILELEQLTNTNDSGVDSVNQEETRIEI